MRFKIRKKVIIAFFAIILSFLAVTGVIAVYNQRALSTGVAMVNVFSMEMGVVHNLQTGILRVLMPANDYLITGDAKYRDDFEREAKNVESRIEEVGALLSRLEALGIHEVEKEKEILEGVRASWNKIREISIRIFETPDPVGNAGAARLMEEMDYEWGTPAAEWLKRWHETDTEELNQAASDVRAAWRRAWMLMAVGFVILGGGGAYFALLFSKKLTSPIDELRKGADAVAAGDLAYRLDLKTGDEIEVLGKAFNQMAASLDESLKSARELADKYASLIRSAPDAILLVDPDSWRVVEANPAAETLMGYTRSELQGLSVEDIHPKDRLKEYMEAFEKAAKEGRGGLLDALVLRKDGSTAPVDISTSVVEVGGRRFLQGFLRDVTERKELERVKKEYTAGLEKRVAERTAELEESLKGLTDSRRAALNLLEDVEQSKKEWEDTFDSISDPLFIHDEQHRLLKCNRAYQALAGAGFKEIIGRPYYEVFPRMDGPFDCCIEAKEVLKQAEEEVAVPEINRVFNSKLYPVTDADGRYLYSFHIMEDVTERKRAEERIGEEMEITSNLFMIAKATATTTDMDALLDQVVGCVREIMVCGCVISLAYLWDEETGRFRPSQGVGLHAEQIPFFRTESIDPKAPLVARAFESRGPALEEASGGGGLCEWVKDRGAMAVIPLIGRKDRLGLLVLICSKESPEAVSCFTKRDTELLRGMAHQVSAALEEARLYKESIDRALALSHKIETIQMMHEIDRSILSALDPGDILEIAAKMISKLVPCDMATVGLVKKEKQGFIYAAGFGVASVPKGALVPFAETSATEVVKTLRPQYIPDVTKAGALLPIEEGLLKEGFLSHIRVPLVVKGEATGVLSVGSKLRASFTPDNLSTIEKLAAQIGVALNNARLVNDLKELLISTIRTLSEAIDAKSPWTRGHSERVTAIALDIAGVMGMGPEKLKDFEVAGLLHDIGKIGTMETVLDKPGKLTDEELKEMRKHPARGAEILSPIRQLEHILPVVRHHHEFYDGTGYPDRLKGAKIPLQARILAVADTVDAMGSDRPYRKGLSQEKITAELKRCSGTQFDPEVVAAFLKILEKDG